MSSLAWPFDSATTLAIVTSVATIVLALVGALTLWEGRRQARIDFILLRLDRLYTPLYEIIREAQGSLFEHWMIADGGPMNSGPIVYWDDRVAPLMAPNTHLASGRLRGLYIRVESDKSERTEKVGGEFIALAGAEYLELVRRLQRLAGEKEMGAANADGIIAPRNPGED